MSSWHSLFILSIKKPPGIAQWYLKGFAVYRLEILLLDSFLSSINGVTGSLNGVTSSLNGSLGTFLHALSLSLDVSQNTVNSGSIVLSCLSDTELGNSGLSSDRILSGQNILFNDLDSLFNGSLNFLSGGLGLVSTSYEHCSSCEHKCNLFHFFAFLNL